MVIQWDSIGFSGDSMVIEKAFIWIYWGRIDDRWDFIGFCGDCWSFHQQELGYDGN